MRIVVINPGSTSTKLGAFDDQKELFSQKIDHSLDDLKGFATIYDQFDYRMNLIQQTLKEKGIFMTDKAYAETDFIAYVACSIGYDFANVSLATKHGIVVCNNPTYCINEVAEHAVFRNHLCLVDPESAAVRGIRLDSISAVPEFHPHNVFFLPWRSGRRFHYKKSISQTSDDRCRTRCLLRVSARLPRHGGYPVASLCGLRHDRGIRNR